MALRRIERRTFLAAAAGTIALPNLVPRSVLAAAGRPGANDRIQVGLIGAGNRCRDLTKESPQDLQLVAVADCDLRQIPAYLAAVKDLPNSIVDARCAHYQDYRQMLSQQKLDAVFVATTHARVLICIDAMRAGLDVYAEKPLTLTIEEGQHLVRAQRKYRRIVQVGSQQRSIAINNFGSDLVRGGALGKIHTVICPNFIGPEPRPVSLPSESTPSEMNWDMWCHQTDLIPYIPKLHPGLGKWGRYREYDGGGLGWGVTGWGTHALDQVQRALGTDDTGPVEIWPEEPGPNCPVTMRFASGTLLKLSLPKGKGPGLGAVFVGETGKIEINRNRLASNPPELIQGAPPPADKSEVASVAQDHIRNWVECLRTRARPVADAEVGHRATTLCHLINICRELGRKLHWDPVKEEFSGDDQANQLRSRPRRKGYELPSETAS